MSANKQKTMLKFMMLYILKSFSIGTDRFEQTMQTQIRLLPKEQPRQGLFCLPFHLHHLELFLYCKRKCSCFSAIPVINSSVPETKISEFANSVDLDEVAHNEPPHLDLHCLLPCI